MTNDELKKLIKANTFEVYDKCINMEASLEMLTEVVKFFKKGMYLKEYPNVYNMDKIRAGFNKFFNKQVDKKYFGLWCTFYGKLIDYTWKHPQTHEEYARNRVADTFLCHTCFDFKDLLRIIEEYNEVAEGKAKLDVDLACDNETYYTAVDESISYKYFDKYGDVNGDNMPDYVPMYPGDFLDMQDFWETSRNYRVLEINHYKKTYQLLLMDTEMLDYIGDGVDRFDQY